MWTKETVMVREPVFQHFLQEFCIKTWKPASEAALRKVEAKAGFSVPHSLRSCYLTCDGGRAQHGPEGPRSAVELLSLEAALKYYPVHGFFASFWGYFPFVENNDSSPVCLCCKSPLAGYVVLVVHDDAPRLMFRSPESFFRAAVKHIKGVEFFDTHDLPSEFDGPDRTKKDLAVARQLIDAVASGDALVDQERTDALRFACDLLSDEHVDEIADLLKDDDEYVREHIAKRLKRIPGAKARKALRQFKGDFDSFVNRCARRLRREGIQASVESPYGQKTIRIDPGPIWLNMEMFFSRRNRPDAEDFFLERARFFVAQENKKRGGRA
jgi:hypothetical protein